MSARFGEKGPGGEINTLFLTILSSKFEMVETFAPTYQASSISILVY